MWSTGKKKKKGLINGQNQTSPFFFDIHYKKEVSFLFKCISSFHKIKMHDTGFSCCCGQDDCERLQEFNECFKKTEYDALLAAGKKDGNSVRSSFIFIQ